jgi:hypothetical protein
MATQRSKQLNLTEADNAVQTAFINPRDAFGRLHPFTGEFNTTDDASPAILLNDVIRLHRIPAGTTLFRGDVTFEAMGAGAELDLGLEAVDGSGFLDKDGLIADDPNFFTQAGTINVSAAGTAKYVNTDVNTHLYVTEKELVVTGSILNAVWDPDKDLKVVTEAVDRT